MTRADAQATANKAAGVTIMPFDGRNRIVIFGPNSDGKSLAISIPRTECAVIRHFQDRMPYGLVVPDLP